MRNNSAPRLRAVTAAIVLAIGASASPAIAFDIPVHIRITNDQIRPLRADVFGKSRGFSEKALEQVGDANEEVDSETALSAALFKPERHFTNENFSGSTQRLVALRKEVIQLVTQPKRDGAKARARLGQALHTIQDFYSHSNWVERGNSGIVSTFGFSTVGNPGRATGPCPSNPNTLGTSGGGSLTSAYFVGVTLNRDTFGCVREEMPPNKCFHGNYKPACQGINKDLDAKGAAEKGVKQNPFHPQAAALARQATRVFVSGILDELNGNDRALAALLDVRGTLAFVVDDSGSMGSTIAGVSGTINQIVGQVSSDPENAPENYMLVSFNDPGVGSPVVSEDSAQLLAAVSSLRPSGGGDCPELSQTGLLRAIGAANSDSRVYLFSDATAKDSSLANQVIAQAQADGIELNYALTGSCSPIDPAYIRGAAETGGQVFRLGPSEIPLLFDVIKPQLKGNQVTIARRRVDLGTGGVDHIDSPVDGLMTALTIAVSVAENDVDARHRLRLFRPDGSQVASTDAGVRSITLSTGAVIHVEAPEPGLWRVEVEGYGPFTATVRGNSDLGFAQFDFVEPNPDIHGGFFALAGQPVTGRPSFGEAALVGPAVQARFAFVGEQGNRLQDVALSREFPDANPEHFVGETGLPTVPFRLAVEGVDAAGHAFRREYPTLYRGQPVELEIAGASLVEATPNVQEELTFTLHNRSAQAAFFRISARDTEGWLTGIEPLLVEVPAVGSAPVTVHVAAPMTATDGAASTLSVTATRVDAPTVFNSARVNIVVVANRAPACGIRKDVTTVWPPNGQMQAVELASVVDVTDPDGDATSLAVTSIMQDEATGSAADGAGVGEAQFRIRAERDGAGDGRVYTIRFRATDPKGAQCSGSVTVQVPHDQSGGDAVDSGPLFDSTQ